MRRAALILAVILAPGGQTLAESRPPVRDSDAAFEGRPLVRRPPRGTCFDPKNRQLCKAACKAAFAACGPARPACETTQAACVARCPPMLCSRGRSAE
ncbi:hypothetical protein [Methylobacterium sp. J-090]|uniref:hypothetical protein n=1 Tax=Methylobacterium sp. J-090 TaxID=2836666 RepID=UPI001FBB4AD1|nr:hypothetical protein [Methylobacterium sp. J-090]MCJ2081724.1 hypothetical protein [Methylobacterium sp. J-090]